MNTKLHKMTRCKRGHFKSKQGKCVMCRRLRYRRYYAQHPEWNARRKLYKKVRCGDTCQCKPNHCRWWKISDIKEAIRLAAEGLSAARISRVLDNGKSRAALASMLNQRGIKLHGQSGPPYGNRNRRGL